MRLLLQQQLSVQQQPSPHLDQQLQQHMPDMQEQQQQSPCIQQLRVAELQLMLSEALSRDRDSQAAGVLAQNELMELRSALQTRTLGRPQVLYVNGCFVPVSGSRGGGYDPPA